MKITLINPAFFDGHEFKNRYNDFLDWVKGGNLYIAPFEPPLGLAYLSSALKNAGHEVHLLDMQGLLMDSESLIKELKKLKPEIVGITSMTTTFPQALKTASLVRNTIPTAKIVFGGVHPTLDPDSTLKYDIVDFVIRGEGEASFVKLVNALANNFSVENIEGLCFKKNGNISVAEKTIILDQSIIPSLDYESFPVETYIRHNEYLRGIRGISMLVSRGCPYPCTFCAVHQTMGRQWRVKSPELVVNEILYLKKRFGIEGIWFKDSIFNLNKKWVTEFCDLLLLSKADIKWQVNTRVDLIEVDQLLLMKSAGLTQIDLGIETGSVKSLEKLKKKISIPQIKEKVALAKKYVKVFGFFMIGIPGENETDVYDTFQLAKDLKLDRSTWSIYSPLPGSILYDELILQGKIDIHKINFEDIHFTKAFEGICDIPGNRLSEIYNEINDFFYKSHQFDTVA